MKHIFPHTLKPLLAGGGIAMLLLLVNLECLAQGLSVDITGSDHNGYGISCAGSADGSVTDNCKWWSSMPWTEGFFIVMKTAIQPVQ